MTKKKAKPAKSGRTKKIVEATLPPPDLTPEERKDWEDAQSGRMKPAAGDLAEVQKNKKHLPKEATTIYLLVEGEEKGTATWHPTGVVTLQDGRSCTSLRQARDVLGVTSGSPQWLWKVKDGERFVPLMALGESKTAKRLRAAAMGAPRTVDPEKLEAMVAKRALKVAKLTVALEAAQAKQRAAEDALEACRPAADPKATEGKARRGRTA